jgi:hypothetical protein
MTIYEAIEKVVDNLPAANSDSIIEEIMGDKRLIHTIEDKAYETLLLISGAKNADQVLLQLILFGSSLFIAGLTAGRVQGQANSEVDWLNKMVQ